MRNRNFSLHHGRSIIDYKYEVKDFAQKNTKTIFFVALICFIGLLTGVLTAIKNINGYSLINFDDFSLSQFLKGNLATSELFFSRLLSYGSTLVVIFISGFSLWLTPFGIAMVVYRAYLVGLNITLLLCLFGFSGFITAVFVVMPCQLIVLVMIICFLVLTISRARYRHKYKCSFHKKSNSNIVWFLVYVLLLTVFNALETFLLLIFSGKIILVI